ncbi:uncharacterized protein LOC108462512 [Gossypium arboreum]|uniref:uncharacterized protein LOC108462512 n=1 Tax=Gossypium arboreum TaxID=29729 RepID=UPI0008197AFA|nr:uncharacterized protein LOC108462512 [Gossypium arboreum]
MASSGFSPAAPPVFSGEGYHIWVVKMRTYLQAFDLWVVNSDIEPAPLRANPIVAQEEFQGTERTRQQQLLNLRNDFENLKMKEEKTVKQYSDRIMAVVSSIRLLGDSSTTAYKGKKTWKDKPKSDAPKKWETPCKHCKRPGHPEAKCWFRPDVQCQHCKKIGHVEKVFKEKIRPRQNQQQPRAEARVAEEGSNNEEQVFAVFCSAALKKVSNDWLLDSGCTNHMSSDAAIFKSLDRNCKSKVKVGNNHFIKAEGKGDVVICTPTGNKIISNVLLVLEIDRNLLSIAQLIEKGYIMVFKENER